MPERVTTGTDPDWTEAQSHLESACERLGGVIRAVGPCRLRARAGGDLFLALMESIVYQQLTGKVAATIFGRVQALFPEPAGPTPAGVVALEDERLRAAGLSGAKVRAIRDLAAKCLAGNLPTWPEVVKMEDERVVESLIQVRGVGPWTAHMFLIFDLGRPDVLPVGDYGVRSAFQKLYRKKELPPPAVLERKARSWRPWRSVASWYLWRSLELGAGTGGGRSSE